MLPALEPDNVGDRVAMSGSEKAKPKGPTRLHSTYILSIPDRRGYVLPGYNLSQHDMYPYPLSCNTGAAKGEGD